jgi:aminoglycoside phosphotransferase (APT) family kinase protein
MVGAHLRAGLREDGVTPPVQRDGAERYSYALAMSWPASEFEVDEVLVRSLLAEQHPDLADLPITQIDAGWDNTLWRLGRELLVRLPRRELAAPLTTHEQRWLPALAPRLPLPVPVPVRFGRPSDRYPWPWSVVPWLSGVPGHRTALTRPDDAAERLGRFLRALHQDAPAEAPRNHYRGVALAQRAETFQERIASLAAEIDVGATRRVWDRGLAADPWSGSPQWLHGDLHPANILVGHGTVAAVIDFGDICSGDPATDLAGAWMLLPAPALVVFNVAYGGVDDGLERRSLAWAVLFALMLLGIGLGDRPSYETVGRSTLARSIAHSEGSS